MRMQMQDIPLSAVIDRQQCAEQPDRYQIHEVVSQQQRCRGGSNVGNHGSEVPEYGVKMVVVRILGELLNAFVLIRIVWPFVGPYQQRNGQICCDLRRLQERVRISEAGYVNLIDSQCTSRIEGQPKQLPR
jgi:hypothetical protein